MSITLPPAGGPAGSPSGSPGGSPGGAPGGLVPDQPGVGLWRGAFRRLRRNPTAIVGAAIILLFVLVAVFAPLLTSYQPGAAEGAGQVTPLAVPGPSEDHWLGLDRYGSDMWTQLVYGARQSLLYGVVSTAIGLTLGAGLGALAGGFGALGGRVGGWVDSAVMRFVDIMLSVPSLLLSAEAWEAGYFETVNDGARLDVHVGPIGYRLRLAEPDDVG